MKSVQTKWWSFCRWFFGGLLTLLGFSSCSEDNPFTMVDMYGSPYVKYEIKGAVKDTKGKPVKDAKVIVRNMYMLNDEMLASGNYMSQACDTLSVNEKGEYHFSQRNPPIGGFFEEPATYRVVAKSPYHKADSVEVSMLAKKNRAE